MPEMPKVLTGKTALVTGASRGIGRGVAIGLAEAGADVAVNYVGSQDEADEAVKQIESLGRRAIAVRADVSDREAVERMVEDVVQHLGGLDILVNNAGGPPPGTTLPRFGFLGLTDVDWQAMLDFNLLSAVRACRAALPHLVQRGEGAIVNVSSGMALQPSAVNVDYSAAKAALMLVTKALAEEFGPQGVRVNGVCPGPTLTAWWTEEGGAADVLAEQTSTDRETVLSKLAPELMQLHTGRLVEPQEIADAVLLLVSPRSGSTSGTELVIDGGMVKAA
jgi:NAD(P)-dependent dehydrogenase (short-subunit alcohol dehydrogenase family)